jgi:hypothetical protein
MNLFCQNRIRVVCLLVSLAATPLLHARLAITEVMSSASTNLGPERVVSRADFWELTNFAADAIDLTHYRFSDSAGLSDQLKEEDEAVFGGVNIGPGESIIFFQFTRDVCTNAAQFRDWWGEHNLPAHLQIRVYNGRGFSSSGDAVQLWHATDEGATLVDRVEIYKARRGFTFSYDPITGFFDSLSAADLGGAFKAVETDDVGSPGFTTGPVPPAIMRHPLGLKVDAGVPAAFTTRAGGMPRPGFQWRFNGAPIAGATGSSFEITTTQPGDAGAYSVELDNGLAKMLSDPATLEVNTISSPPRIDVPPTDLVVTPGQTAVFHVSARGYPLPAFQWHFNGEEIPGATGATLHVPGVDFSFAGEYSVRIKNPLGSMNAAAFLAVQANPFLRITEMMGSRSTNTTVFGRGDWWELTNFDAEPVNLRGFRFDDYPGVLEGAVVITDDLILQPGASVLFIQEMSPDFFKLWWGEENLPENQQFFRYEGNGINANYDSITLWNATALELNDFVTRAEYVHLDRGDFTPVRGLSLSFWCDDPIEFGQPSVLGECGAIRAAGSEDIGSPGFVRNHPSRPKALGISQNAGSVHLTWKTEVGFATNY